jgi:pyruvate formate lyase activating enzyme
MGMRNKKLFANKGNKVAEYWTSVEGEGVVNCTLCPHRCVLKEGEVGKCRTRKNVRGELISMVYGYPCALHIDPIEKKPMYHFLPGSQSMSISTIGCNLRCLNCQNYQISQADFNRGDFDYATPRQIVEMAMRNQCESISYTYTDPIVYYEYAKDTAVLAHEHGIKNVIVSAGYINKKPLREWCKYIDGANIDLKGFDDKIYQELNSIRLKPVLNTLEVLKEEGVWLEITNLIVPEYTDDLNVIEQMCIWLYTHGFADVPLHFSRFFPTHKLSNLNPTSLEVLEAAYKIAQSSGIKYVYLGNVAQTETNQTYCANCNKILISRLGYQISGLSIQNGSCVKCGNKIPGIWS